MVANHLMFPDDISVFDLSISGLQNLLNISCDYVAERIIVFNCKKTVGVVFPPININSVLKTS